MSVTREDAADFLMQLVAWSTKYQGVVPSLDDMRLIYLARQTVTLMSRWTIRSKAGARKHEAQAALLSGYLDRCMDGKELRPDAFIQLNEDAADLLRGAAYALTEYGIKEKAEKTWK